MKGSVFVKIGVSFLRDFFFLDFAQQQLFCEESKPCTMNWLDVHLWGSHKILDGSRGRTSASHGTR